MQRDVARRHRQHVLDQRARKADAPVIALNRPGPGQDLHPRGRGLAQARSAPAPPSALSWICAIPASVRGLYCPPGMPGPHRAHVIGQGCRPHRHPRLAARPTAAPAPVRKLPQYRSSLMPFHIGTNILGGSGGQTAPRRSITRAPVPISDHTSAPARPRPHAAPPPPRSHSVDARTSASLCPLQGT